MTVAVHKANAYEQLSSQISTGTWIQPQLQLMQKHFTSRRWLHLLEDGYIRGQPVGKISSAVLQLAMFHTIRVSDEFCPRSCLARLE